MINYLLPLFLAIFESFPHIVLLKTWFIDDYETGDLCLSREPLTVPNLQNAKSLMYSCSLLLGEIVERFLFLKISLFGYWNKVSMNLRFVGITILSITYTSLLSTFNILNANSLNELKWLEVTTFAAIFTTLFWQERASYYEKWSYLSNLYNEVLTAKPYVLGAEAATDDVYSHRESLKVALAMDIISMEMWSHNSFKSIITETLKSAVKYQSKTRKQISDNDLYYLTKGLTKKNILDLLSQYQQHILEEEKASYKARVYLAA